MTTEEETTVLKDQVSDDLGRDDDVEAFFEEDDNAASKVVGSSTKKQQIWMALAGILSLALASLLVIAVNFSKKMDDNAIPQDLLDYERDHPFLDERQERQARRDAILRKQEEDIEYMLLNEEFDSDEAQESFDDRHLQPAGFLLDFPCGSAVSCTSPTKYITESDLNAADQLNVPCGECWEVSITNGITVELPSGVRIHGKLHFPSSTDVTIRTTHVFVMGELKIDEPADGKQVKFLLHGDDLFHSYYGGACAAGGCFMGSKVIAVLGGKLDIKGYDSACPAWEKLTKVGPPKIKPFDPPCDGTGTCFELTIAGPCEHSEFHTNSWGKYIVKCPIEPTLNIPYGDSNRIKFASMLPVFRIQNLCSVSAKADELNKCVLECPLDTTVNIAGGEVNDFEFTSIKPTSDATPMLPCNNEGNCVTEIKTRGQCQHSSHHTSAHQKYTVKCPIEQTASIPFGYGGSVKFVSPDGATEMEVPDGILHFAWDGWTLFFFPPNNSINQIQSEFPPGSVINIIPTAPGGDVMDVEEVYDWAKEGSLVFSPSGISRDACNYQAKLFNQKFPPGYEIDVAYKNLHTVPTTGQEIQVSQGVIHWAWGGNELYFSPDEDVSVVNAKLPPQSRIQVSHPDLKIYDEIHVTPAAASCWKPGTELLLTSHTRWSDDKQFTTVKSVDTGSGRITLEIPLEEKPISLDESSDFAVEVASLTRGVKFDAESTSGKEDFGGHLVIHNTQQAQHLEGIEITNFGQLGLLGKYPIHFHDCGNSYNSLVKKNVVRSSNQRGYVIHFTNYVTIEDNIAVDVVGHCYFLEAGTETNNKFSGNLGAGVKNMPLDMLEGLGSGDTDNNSSVYWISNPENEYVGNVAAGSQSFGFWIETRGTNSGKALKLFENNEVHSSQHFGFTVYPPGWTPNDDIVLTNLKVYRNSLWGGFLHVTQKLKFKGGIFADNGAYGVYINRGDDIIFEDTKFDGFTGFAEPYSHCATYGQRGIALHPGLLRDTDMTGTIRGTSLVRTEFRHFSQSDVQCASASGNAVFAPIQFRHEQTFIPAYIATQRFEGVSIDASSPKIHSCLMYSELGIENAVVEVTGDTSTKTFSPTGNNGFLVSKGVSELLPPGSCSVYNSCPGPEDGGALHFCEGVCLRIIRIMTNAHETEGVDLVVTSPSGVSETYPGLLRSNEPVQGRFYTIVLPKDSYQFHFKGADGNMMWPRKQFRTVFQAAPTCQDYITPDDINYVQPDAERISCNNLIDNGNFDSSIDGWDAGFSMVWRSNEGVGASGALRTLDRPSFEDKISQYLDSSCIQAGDQISINFSYRDIDSSGNSVSACTDCIRALVKTFDFNPTTGHANANIKWEVIGETVMPYQSGGSTIFNTVTGVWQVTEQQAQSDYVQIFIDYGTGGQLILDNISMQKL